MKSADSQMRQRVIQRAFVPYFVLLLSLLITFLFSFYVQRSARASDQVRFNSSVQDLTTFLSGRPRLYVEVLRAGTGLFAVNPSVDPDAFHKFVERLELAERYPGAQAIGFVARVKRADKDSFNATLRRQGLKEFEIKPEQGQVEYNPVVSFEPLAPHNQIEVGYDISTNPVLHAALERARDTGLPAASGRVILNTAGESPSFFIYAPIYRDDVTPKSVSERRDTLSGFVYAQFRAADLIRAILATRDFGAIDMQIYDGPQRLGEHLLYETPAEAIDSARSATKPLQSTTAIDVAGRTWSIAFSARPEFYSSGLGVYSTALSGLVLSLMLFSFTRSQARARAAAEQSAFELQESEAKVRATLTERERAETALRESEEALREADQRALTEYKRLLERITSLAQALGTARDLSAIYYGLQEFTIASVPCDGFFVSLYDPMRNVRTASYGWGDDREIDVSPLPSMPITADGPNSRAVRTGQIVITNDYMKATRGYPVVVVGPENGLRPQTSMAVPMSVMGRIVGTIEVQSYQRSAYREEHATAMRMAANLTGVAIENVRLLERESTARAVAEESNRLKDEFLATVSHELRTPLTAILGWSRMLETGGLDAPIAARALETIRRNAKSQSQIIDDILDVSRIITGNLNLDLTPTDLTPVIEAAINVVRPTAEAKGIEIEAAYDPQPSMVPGDANRLQQVFWNLLSNAIKFTPSGGRVRISRQYSDSHAEIRVSDNGQGINSDFLPFVFDRFRQADSTSTRRHGGLGLGLAITRHLVEIHGGSIKAESSGEGLGATFTVSLPIVSSSATRRDDGQKSAVEGSIAKHVAALDGLHVLLVDDDTDTLEMISAAFTKLKARVTAVVSADEAMVRINEAKPDVIVSDIAMPGADGYDLLRRVRAFESDHEGAIPAVAITAYAREEDRERALSFGFQDYLPKPIEPAELIAIVSKLVERDPQGDSNGKQD